MRQGVLVKMNSGAELVPKGNTGGSGTDDGYVASLLENLDRCRGEVGTFEQLCALLDVCNPHLPAQIQAQRIAPTEPEGVKPVAYQLTINGPLRAVPHPEVLSIAEDILVEDCQDDFCLVNIVCNDILFNRRTAFLPPTDPHAKDLAENKTESLTRLLSFLKNVTDAFSGSLRDYAFTRCDISSLDFGHTFPIPSLFPPLHSLMFTHCKLTGSHVAALLEWARRENSEAASGHTRCFQSLHTLQLCGAVTAQCVDDLLDYFLDELDQNQFRFLRLPADLVEGAKRHAFCQTNTSFRVEEIAFT
ncbi:hypothetical protein, conserved [Angomonas deanei]|uniref:Uncharacterized protein n=1 Tax=Angomonas deanei TaxID=59799 RepID=A0A7G2CGD7_9TRYP|nr:hypothetical protein, conserved [Angomonas deanei]